MSLDLQGARWAGTLPGFLLILACVPAADPAPLKLVDWPGRNGVEVLLDAPLRFEFDAPLALDTRPGCLQIRIQGVAEPLSFARVSVVGPMLLVNPRLPLRAKLEDGSLPAGSILEAELFGLPKLSALRGQQGNVLVRSVQVQFRTRSAADPDALGGAAPPVDLLHLQLPGSTLRRPRAQVEVDGTVRLPVDQPMDPRSLSPATLQFANGQSRQVLLRLASNLPQGAILETYVGSWSGFAVLELPTTLAGIGGALLAPRDLSVGLLNEPGTK